MHMPNEVLSPQVAAATIVAATVAVGISSWRARRRLDESRLPMMGVMGAFVFAAQMINFPILPGASGHLGGGPLLAILLGPSAAIVVMTAILTIQCLVFNDGGLLALGANVINMGVVSCLVGYGVYRLILGNAATVGRSRFYLAVFLGTFLGMLSGAVLVPFEIAVSGLSAVPFLKLFVVMVGVHVLIASVEGVVTFAVITTIGRVRSELVDPRVAGGTGRLSRTAVTISVLIVALLVAGLLSLLASSHPDGLEYVLGDSDRSPLGRTVVPDADVSPAVLSVSAWQEKTAPLPDYSVRAEGEPETSPYWTSLAGVLGTAVTLALLYGIALGLRHRNKKARDVTISG